MGRDAEVEGADDRAACVPIRSWSAVPAPSEGTTAGEGCMKIPKWAAKHLLYLPVARIQAGPVARYIRELESTQREAPEARRRRQLDRLRSLLASAAEHVPYYRQVLAGAEPSDVRSLDDLGRLPFLTKSDLQEHQGRLRSEGPVGRLVSKTTGGSTGQPVTILKTRDAMARELAATWRGYQWAGVGIGDLQARFWGVPISPGAQRKAELTDFVCNRIRLSAFAFSEEDLAGYHRLLNRARPDYFYGYVSMLQEYANYIRRAGQTPLFRPRCIITTSEVLTDPVRSLLSETFSAPVYDEYGCGELGTIAHECRHGTRHISEENMIVEILDGDRVCGPGEAGEIVVTELNNTGMPLIRYRTGDYGSLGEGECGCGVTLRALSGVHGRAYDFIQGEGGRRFHGESVMYIFEELKGADHGIRQFQFIQEGPDAFRVRIVRESGYDAQVEDVIAKRVRETIHASAGIRFEYVDRIERSNSGKMRLIVGLGTEPGWGHDA